MASKKVTLFLFMIFIALNLYTPVLAQTDEESVDSTTPTVKETRMEKKPEVMEKRETVKTDVMEKREATKEKITERTQTMKANIEARREEMKAKMEEKREALKEKLTEIKDQKKKAIVERMNTRMTERNAKAVDHMNSVLERFDAFVAKLQERIAAAKAKGADTSSAEAALAGAISALSTARTSVEAQAARDYTLEINDETTLKNDVGGTVQQFQTDLKSSYDSVKNVKEALIETTQELAKLRATDKPEVQE